MLPAGSVSNVRPLVLPRVELRRKRRADGGFHFRETIPRINRSVTYSHAAFPVAFPRAMSRVEARFPRVLRGFPVFPRVPAMRNATISLRFPRVLPRVAVGESWGPTEMASGAL